MTFLPIQHITPYKTHEMDSMWSPRRLPSRQNQNYYSLIDDISSPPDLHNSYLPGGYHHLPEDTQRTVIYNAMSGVIPEFHMKRLRRASVYMDGPLDVAMPHSDAFRAADRFGPMHPVVTSREPNNPSLCHSTVGADPRSSEISIHYQQKRVREIIKKNLPSHNVANHIDYHNYPLQEQPIQGSYLNRLAYKRMAEVESLGGIESIHHASNAHIPRTPSVVVNRSMYYPHEYANKMDYSTGFSDIKSDGAHLSRLGQYSSMEFAMDQNVKQYHNMPPMMPHMNRMSQQSSLPSYSTPPVHNLSSPTYPSISPGVNYGVSNKQREFKGGDNYTHASPRLNNPINQDFHFLSEEPMLNKGYFVKFLFNKCVSMEFLAHDVQLRELFNNLNIGFALTDVFIDKCADRWCIMTAEKKDVLLTGMMFLVHICRRTFTRKKRASDKTNQKPNTTAKGKSNYTRTTFKLLIGGGEPEKLSSLKSNIQKFAEEVDQIKRVDADEIDDVLKSTNGQTSIISTSITDMPEIVRHIEYRISDIVKQIDTMNDKTQLIVDPHFRVFLSNATEDATLCGVVSAIKADPTYAIGAIYQILSWIIDYNEDSQQYLKGEPLDIFSTKKGLYQVSEKQGHSV